MTYTVTLIPGDGIGPEVASAAVRVLSATGVSFEWENENAGAGTMGKWGTALPARVLDSIRRTRVALKGP
ncbi:MAG TPA: isocitrate/isopropylmalate family dehydrogenase, partial [Vicinamibacteria bacterium]|nr:isocitrate/isopropylmalate family dehydrogenase [Vicinamibacteria bacterium]